MMRPIQRPISRRHVLPFAVYALACVASAGIGLRIGIGNISAASAADPAPAASVEYLSDQATDRVRVVQEGWGRLGRNTGIRPATGEPLPLRIGKKTYARGLGTHADSELIADLDGEFERFDAEIGVLWQSGDGESRAKASVVFEVLVDGETKFTSPVLRESDPARAISIPVHDASTLQLVVRDAGDGIMFDAACWADARLTRSTKPAAPASPLAEADIAPFAEVRTWPANRPEGTKAGRVEDFPAADVRLGREIARDAQGRWLVAAQADGAGSIGLEWYELRSPRTATIEWAGEPPADARLEIWHGESTWQGRWIACTGPVVKTGPAWSWTLRGKDLQSGICKLRWVIPQVKPTLAVRRMTAVSRDRWTIRNLRVEAVAPLEPKQPGNPQGTGAEKTAPQVRIEPYNARLLDAGDRTTPTLAGTLDRPWTFRVASSKANRDLREQAILRFQVGDRAFGVGLKDVVAAGCVYIPHAGIAVALDPPAVPIREFIAQSAGKKTILQEVRERPDQTFARAMEKVHNPIQDRCPTMISLAADNRKFVIERNGRLLFNLYDSPYRPHPEYDGSVADNLLFNQNAYVLTPQCGEQGTPTFVGRRLARTWYPIPVTTLRHGDVLYQIRSGVFPLERQSRTNADAWMPLDAACVVEYVLENPRDAKAEAFLKLSLGNAGKPNAPIALREIREGAVGLQGDRAAIFADAAGLGPLKLRVDATSLTIAGTLEAKGRARLAVFVPGRSMTTADCERLRHRNAWEQDVAAYWDDVLKPATQIDTPDAFYNDVVRASHVHCLLAARNEADGRRIAAWIGADRYGPLESEAHAVIRGMDLLGQESFASRGLEYFLHRINANGSLNTGYTLLGTGVHAWVLADHYDRTGDKAWASHAAPKAAAACEWIASQCRKTVGRDAAGNPFPESGLFPPGVYADWNRYAYRFAAQGIYYAGLSNGSRLLRAAGHPQADAVAAAADRLRADTTRAYLWTQARSPVAKLRNDAWIPRTPAQLGAFGDIGDLYRGEDYGRAYAYDTECGPQNMVAGGILDPLSQEVGWMLDRLEDDQFLVAGWQDYPLERVQADPYNLGGFAKIQPYYARAIEMYAARDDVKPYLRAYFNALSTLLSRENLSFWEHFRNTAGWNKTHETGWFLCQTRFLFVMERGDDLWLAPFVTDRWLCDGGRVVVANAPTRFGPTGFEITSHAARGFIEATVQPPTRTPPKQIVLRLRHPEGKAMQRVTVDGRAHAAFDAGAQTIRLAPTDKAIRVRVEYGP